MQTLIERGCGLDYWTLLDLHQATLVACLLIVPGGTGESRSRCARSAPRRESWWAARMVALGRLHPCADLRHPGRRVRDRSGQSAAREEGFKRSLLPSVQR
jgi:hypothetical protein